MKSTASELFLTNRDLAEMCHEHPFIKGVASGGLERSAFTFYVAQDATFLEAFVRAYALCLAKAPDRQSMDAFKALLDGGFEELSLHHSYADRWGVDLEAAAAPATKAYTDFLLRVAALEPVGHACAAMAPCMRLYAWLGRELEPIAPADSPYRQWVDTYAGRDFQQLAATLEGLLDELGGDETIIARHYRSAMELELNFFAAAYDAR